VLCLCAIISLCLMAEVKLASVSWYPSMIYTVQPLLWSDSGAYSGGARQFMNPIQKLKIRQDFLFFLRCKYADMCWFVHHHHLFYVQWISSFQWKIMPFEALVIFSEFLINVFNWCVNNNLSTSKRKHQLFFGTIKSSFWGTVPFPSAGVMPLIAHDTLCIWSPLK